MAREIITMSSGFIEDKDKALKITIEGESEMPFWNHDLKVKAILMLLDSIDIKQYHEDNKSQEAYESYNEIIEATKAAFSYDDGTD
ncbi:hypothetical protein [Sporosarcina sp. Marseille-Q4943]|uniref:hypothetical protein n=1 Tax=Sporosarcina sp. Marseille-Q4943 TaxID=2942204 RepID=UPI00208DC6C2|nr:hypothetical protein [Sporosarcina sp. Marseille-Q4943]